MRVLFVEDNEVNRRVIREMLRAGGVEMTEAENGQVGLDMIATQTFDLVLMDLRMPKMDGLTAIRHIRARPDDKAALPVIVLTADDGATIDRDCLAAGADAVLHKPVAMPALFEAIAAALTGRGSEDATMIA